MKLNANTVVNEIISQSDKMLRVIVALEDTAKGDSVITFHIKWNTLTEIPAIFLGNTITSNTSVSIPFEGFKTINSIIDNLSKVFDHREYLGLNFVFR